MSKPKLKKSPKPKRTQPDLANLDLDPDAWPLFEATVKRAAKMGHKPHAQRSKRKKA
jgi:hypothetical protein